MLMISSKFSLMPYWLCIKASPLSLSWPIVQRRYVFNWRRELTGIVQIKRRIVWMLGHMFFLPHVLSGYLQGNWRWGWHSWVWCLWLPLVFPQTEFCFKWWRGWQIITVVFKKVWAITRWNGWIYQNGGNELEWPFAVCQKILTLNELI